MYTVTHNAPKEYKKKYKTNKTFHTNKKKLTQRAAHLSYPAIKSQPKFK